MRRKKTLKDSKKPSTDTEEVMKAEKNTWEYLLLSWLDKFVYARNNKSNLIKCQCCPHIETSQLIYTANQLTGFYMRATLALNWLIFKITRTMWKQMNQLNSKLVKLTLKSFATWMFKTGALLLNTVAHPPYHLNLKQQMLR